MSNRPNDPHFHSVEEARHREHAQRREAARAGDGTLTLETEAAQLATIRHRREVARLRDTLRDAMEQKQEAQNV
jgi:hypothetical protein